MTVSTNISSQTFQGNGSQTVFPFSIVNYSSSTYILTYTDASGNETILSPSTYTLTLNAAATGQQWGIGGSITYPNVGSPIAVDTTLTITRFVPLLQQTNFSNQGTLWPTSVEQAMDILCMEIQQIAARTGQYRGTWATSQQYLIGDIIVDGANGDNTGNYYMCVNNNTSGTWATDLSNGDWILFIDIVAINAAATSAAASAAAAASSASAASSSATSASSSASSASSSATSASNSATSAASSATSASNSASSASTSASNAATSATNAATSATNASNSATSASNSATAATTEAGIATTQATNAAASATSAAASAVLAGTALTATSTTSNTIGTGTFTFTTQANKNFFAGQTIIAASNANSSNYIHGQVASYSGTTLVITETDNGGSGTHADWNISVSGTQGTAGTGVGTVTNVAVSGSNGISVSGSPITSSGTIALGLGAITPSSINTSGQITSTVTTGTAPLVVSSTTPVANLSIGGNATTATTATNATNTAITDDTTTNSTMYPTWVTANTGNLPQKTTSTRLSFNPSTGALSSTSFSGAGTGLTGTASSLTSGLVTNGVYTTDTGTVTNTMLAGSIALSKLANQAADTFLANATSGSAAPTAIALAASQLAGRGSTGDIAAISLGSGLSMSGTTLSASGSSELVLISTLTASSSSTLNFTGLSTSYSSYVFVFDSLLISAAASIGLASSSNSGSTYANTGQNSQKAVISIGGSTAPTYTGVSSATPIALTTAPGSGVAYNGRMDLVGDSSSTNFYGKCALWWSSGANPVYETTFGITGMVGALQFLPSSGNFTSGTIYCYGIKNT